MKHRECPMCENCKNSNLQYAPRLKAKVVCCTKYICKYEPVTEIKPSYSRDISELDKLIERYAVEGKVSVRDIKKYILPEFAAEIREDMNELKGTHSAYYLAIGDVARIIDNHMTKGRSEDR